VTFLLPFDPVVAKNAKAKGLGVNVLGTAAEKPVIGATVGKTGMELRWHEPQKFSKLTKEQKFKLSEWNKTQRKRDGGKKCTSKRAKSAEKWKKARVASMSKTHAELMEAMADFHSADMAVMNVRIAGMTNIPPAGVATGRVGAAVGSIQAFTGHHLHLPLSQLKCFGEFKEYPEAAVKAGSPLKAWQSSSELATN